MVNPHESNSQHLGESLKIYFHRDFDGMASAAILAQALEDVNLETDITWSGVNFHRTLEWETFAEGEKFAVVDFHFHPRALYWFDHHPTTFLDEADERNFRADSTRAFDPDSPSCPPIIAQHAATHWSWEMPTRFTELVHWSNIIDAAAYASAKEALFDRRAPFQINRALNCAPSTAFHDRLVGLMKAAPLDHVADDSEVKKCAQRAERNRDAALELFPTTMVERTDVAMLADLRSPRIRRERFAPFFLYPELNYAVTLIPTRAGNHITAASNPWNRPQSGPHLGELMKKFGGGGHKGVGGVNPPNGDTAEKWAREIYEAVAYPQT